MTLPHEPLIPQPHPQVTSSRPPPGDFFRSRLPRADLYILARVLHDWTDADATRLLGRIGRAGGQGQLGQRGGGVTWVCHSGVTGFKQGSQDS